MTCSHLSPEHRANSLTRHRLPSIFCPIRPPDGTHSWLPWDSSSRAADLTIRLSPQLRFTRLASKEIDRGLRSDAFAVTRQPRAVRVGSGVSQVRAAFVTNPLMPSGLPSAFKSKHEGSSRTTLEEGCEAALAPQRILSGAILR